MRIMKNTYKKLYNTKQWILSIVKKYFQSLFFKMIFKKIPKKLYGRCITCDANQLCHKPQYRCKCTMEQQYMIRDLRNLL